MKILFTLDYELFLGARTGTVQRCLVEPMSSLTAIGDKYGVKFTLFVDATYLCALKKYREQFPALSVDYSAIVAHLQELSGRGHDIQLHIHPQWAYSTYNGQEWIMDAEHYKLSDLAWEDARAIFFASKKELEDIVRKPVVAYRAGGYSAQPTEMLVKLFNENGVKVDSSVYPGAYYSSQQQQYDYRSCPNKDLYRFEKDICIEDPKGSFVEVPISTLRVSPLFYWKLVLTKIFKSEAHKSFGNGVPVQATKESITKRLTRFSDALATIDGYKISYLRAAYCKSKKRHNIFCVIGHPKATTPYSLKRFERFCKQLCSQNTFITMAEL